MPRTVRPARSPRGPGRAAVVVVLALLASLLPGIAVAAGLGGPAAAAEGGRTWVIDAVDDQSSNRWESVDTGTTVVTIAVGDTVEWQFDQATQGHDLVSLAPTDPYDSAWPTPMEEYRNPGGEAVRYTFDEPGTYRFECSLHGPMMSGTVVVAAPGDNTAPTADPVVEPTSGPAPLVVHATANAGDPDGDVVTTSWDFGTGDAPAHTDHAMFEYTTPGQYVARLRVSDSRGGLHVEEFPITVTAGGGGTDPQPADDALPEIDALASPASGTAPLAVAFSTEVTTRGVLHPYSVGLDDYPELSGAATLVRRRGGTATSLTVAGAKASTEHKAVHVHEQACDDALGGAHFRFDTSQPFAEPNEIWPLFTTDASGDAQVEVTKPLRAGPLAVSIVVHDPANSARRIGCADLGPLTGDLAYAWDFGDGTAGTGADPDHTYGAPGTYTATVTVTHTAGEHASHMSVTDTVQVTVDGAVTSPPPTVPPLPPAPPTVEPDTTAPRITRVTPRRQTRRHRLVIRARVHDDSRVRRRAIVVRVDGRRARWLRWDADRGLLRAKPRQRLAHGKHRIVVVVRDAAGNKARKVWRFRVR